MFYCTDLKVYDGKGRRRNSLLVFPQDFGQLNEGRGFSQALLLQKKYVSLAGRQIGGEREIKIAERVRVSRRPRPLVSFRCKNPTVGMGWDGMGWDGMGAKGTNRHILYSTVDF